MRSPRLILVLALATAVAAGANARMASAGELAQQTSSDRGVTVRAKPVDVATSAKAWTFEIVLETHRVDLTDDVQRIATLAGTGGVAQNAKAWEGDPPGGHHRKGLLRFAPIAPRPDGIELRILRPGESAPRSFRWDFK